MTINERGALTIVRVFDFPRESVFKMWTDPKKVAEWWGPEGCVNIVSEVDARTGGRMRVDQRSPRGDVSSFKATFERVIPLELLIYKAKSPGTSDEYGGYSAHETLETVTFEELGPKRTRVTVVTEILAGPLDERESLLDAFRGGWGESLDKLQRSLR